MRAPPAMEIVFALECLGVTPAEYAAPTRAASREQGQRMLAELQERMSKAWKRLALELHPDRTGGDPGKTEAFKRVAAVVSWFSEVTLPPPRPYPNVRVVTVTVTTSAAGPTWGGTNGGWPFW